MNLRSFEKGILGIGLALMLSPQESMAQKHEKLITPLSQLKDYYKSKANEKIDSLDYTEDEFLQVQQEHRRYAEIALHPEVYYKNLWSEVNRVKAELKCHFESVSFFSKLLDNNDFSSDLAKAFQTKFIYNLESLTISLAKPITVENNANRTTGSICYLPKSHEILISYLGATSEEIAYALINALYTDNVTVEEACVLIRSFRRDNNSSEEANNYLSDPLIRMVYKKMLDLEMQKFGILYNKKFGSAEYKIILHQRMAGKLSPEATDLLDTCTEKQLIEIMNSLA